MWGHALETENTTTPQPAREQGSQSYNHRKLNSANKLNEPGSSSPEPPWRKAALLKSRLQPCEILRRESGEPH